MGFFKRLKTKKLPSPSINSLVKEEDIEALTEELNVLSPFELADLIVGKSEAEQSILFCSLSPEIALQTFDFLSPQVQRKLLQVIPTMQAASLLKDLFPDDRTLFLQDLPKEVINELLKLVPYEERKEAITLLGYPKDSIGRLMTPDYIAVKLDWNIEKVLDHIRDYGHDSETIDVIYVIDDRGKLLDDIKLKDFLFVPKQSLVASIADNKFIALSVNERDNTALNIFKTYDRLVLPVIDEKGILLGIITIDDILRLADQEATEDIQNIRAMALGEVKLRDWWKILKREIISGIFLGTILGAIGFFRVSLWSVFTDIYGVHWLLVAITIALSLIGVVLFGTLSGAILPLILRRAGVDPATSSAPFIATIVDVTGLVIYFMIAILILKGTVL